MTKDDILGGNPDVQEQKYEGTVDGQATGSDNVGSGQTTTGGANDDVPQYDGGASLPAMTYDEVKDFADTPQEPNADISGMKDKPDPDGESDVNDETLSNTLPDGSSALDNTSSKPTQNSNANAPWGDGDFYTWAFNQLEPYKPPTQEEIEAERKKQKRNALLAAIGDGLGAFHTAFAHARGEKPMAIPNMSGKLQERYDKIKAERDKNSAFYLNSYLNLMRQKRADETAEINAQYKRDLISLRQQDMEYKMNKYQAEIDRLVAQGKTEEARQLALQAQAEYYQARADGVRISNMPTIKTTVSNGPKGKTTTVTTTKHDDPAVVNNNAQVGSNDKGKGYGDDEIEQGSKGRGY